VNVPLVSVTVPVGVDEDPVTAIFTGSESVIAMLDLAGVTATLGAVGFPPPPPPVLPFPPPQAVSKNAIPDTRHNIPLRDIRSIPRLPVTAGSIEPAGNSG